MLITRNLMPDANDIVTMHDTMDAIDKGLMYLVAMVITDAQIVRGEDDDGAINDQYLYYLAEATQFEDCDFLSLNTSHQIVAIRRDMARAVVIGLLPNNCVTIEHTITDAEEVYIILDCVVDGFGTGDTDMFKRYHEFRPVFKKIGELLRKGE